MNYETQLQYKNKKKNKELLKWRVAGKRNWMENKG